MPKLFATEADLCQAFISSLPKGWVAFPETAGWDILLVRTDTGTQIGIEAKLSLNAKVIDQALENGGYFFSARLPGPDFRAVLVPRGGVQKHLTRICEYVGLTVITVDIVARDRYRWEPDLPDARARSRWFEEQWHPQFPMRRCTVPQYKSDAVVAGAKGPRQLTDWHIRVLKLSAVLHHNGVLTREDFARLEIDHRRWTAPGKLLLVKSPDGYVKGSCWPERVLRRHANVYDEMLKDPAIVGRALKRTP